MPGMPGKPKKPGIQKNAAEDVVRRDAVYFLEGTWPDIIQSQLPDGVFKNGETYIIAIIPKTKERK